MDLAELRRKLSAHHQDKTLRFVDQLPEAGKKKLLGQLSAVDLDSVSAPKSIPAASGTPAPRSARQVDRLEATN